jgi:hypothetical protein
MLVLGLADGIDNRGGHACGYVSIDTKKDDLKYARKRGVWVRSRLRFIEGAAQDVCLMHARFATCGNRDDSNNAHPFAIRRNGRVVLWGAHNGMVPDAFASAKKNGRSIEVDSQEIFELLADRDYEGIQNMAGYGVVTWIESSLRDSVYLARLSSHSDIILVSIKGGGYVWASTRKILTEALKFADLEAEEEFVLDDIGRVYLIAPDGVFKTDCDGVRVGNWQRWKGKNATHSAEEMRTPKPPVDLSKPVETKPWKEETSYTSTGTGNYSGYGYGMYGWGEYCD